MRYQVLFAESWEEQMKSTCESIRHAPSEAVMSVVFKAMYLMLFGIFAVGFAWAQVSTGTIVGTVGTRMAESFPTPQ